MYYSRSRIVNIVSVLSIIMIVYGMYYSSIREISLNYAVLVSFIVINGLNIYFDETRYYVKKVMRSYEMYKILMSN